MLTQVNAEHIFVMYRVPSEGGGDVAGLAFAVDVEITGSTAAAAGAEDGEILDGFEAHLRICIVIFHIRDCFY